jgi:hypothetical protein
MLEKALILRQNRGIARPKLSNGQVHKPPPERRCAADQEEIVGGKEYGRQAFSELRSTAFDTV